jgi:hypothetical protein
MEANAVALGLQLLDRQSNEHDKRIFVLVDAKTVRAAGQKGRTSADTLRHAMRRCSALSLACGWLVRYVYVPSESNLADWPSRGLDRRRELARFRNRVDRGSKFVKCRPSRLELALRERTRACQRLYDCGNLPTWNEEGDVSESSCSPLESSVFFGDSDI